MSILKLKPFGVEIAASQLPELKPFYVQQQLRANHLVVIRGLNGVNESDLVKFARALSHRPGGTTDQLLHWSFGPVMNMRFDPSTPNYLFSSECVPFHWDGAFFREPQYLVFYCEASQGCGGETLFCNTPLIWNKMSREKRRAFESVRLSYTTEKKAHYGGNCQVPLVQKHPLTGQPILRFAEEVDTKLNPVDLQIEVHSKLDANQIYRDLVNLVYSPEHCLTHQWRAGDLVIADNFSLIHGRKALGDNRARSFKRLQVM